MSNKLNAKQIKKVFVCVVSDDGIYVTQPENEALKGLIVDFLTFHKSVFREVEPFKFKLKK